MYIDQYFSVLHYYYHLLQLGMIECISYVLIVGYCYNKPLQQHWKEANDNRTLLENTLEQVKVVKLVQKKPLKDMVEVAKISLFM